jgi:adenine-specific DNA-methyltransferase
MGEQIQYHQCVAASSQIQSVSECAYQRFLQVLKDCSPLRQKELGQYPTQAAIATFMANRFELPSSDSISVLDAGAGTGVLAAALVERLINCCKKLKRIHLDCFEVAPELLPDLRLTLASLRIVALRNEIELIARVMPQDFVTAATRMAAERNYDMVVMNPPYFKIAANSVHAKAVPEVCHGQPNIYMLFMYLGAKLLAPAGELVTITPRSFASGEYFRLFRLRFFDLVNPAYIHIFESRDDAFADSRVLQENVIIKFDHSARTRIQVSVSSGVSDLECPSPQVLLSELLLDRKSSAQILKLPSNKEQVEALRNLLGVSRPSMRSLGLRVSTGKVVPFRAKSFLRGAANRLSAPLIWMQNFQRGEVLWPLSALNKPQHIHIHPSTQSLLVRNDNYVLVRRFSSKDDKHRIVAAPFLSKDFSSEYVAFENHVNFIWSAGRRLTKRQVEALASYLNSGLVENYMRAISGNTQIGASELLELPVTDELAALFGFEKKSA